MAAVAEAGTGLLGCGVCFMMSRRCRGAVIIGGTRARPKGGAGTIDSGGNSSRNVIGDGGEGERGRETEGDWTRGAGVIREEAGGVGGGEGEADKASGRGAGDGERDRGAGDDDLVEDTDWIFGGVTERAFREGRLGRRAEAYRGLAGDGRAPDMALVIKGRGDCGGEGDAGTPVRRAVLLVRDGTVDHGVEETMAAEARRLSSEVSL